MGGGQGRCERRNGEVKFLWKFKKKNSGGEGGGGGGGQRVMVDVNGEVKVL